MTEFQDPKSWTPGFGKPYYVEEKFYKSPKVKDANLPEDRTDRANAGYTKYDKYFTRDEILDIWAKPLDSRDYQVTSEEKGLLQAQPNLFHHFLFVSRHSPCAPHIFNMKLDECNNPSMLHKYSLTQNRGW